MNADKNLLIQMTKGLYKLTLLFPKKEPLRYKIREVADEILARPRKEDFEILDSFFEVAKEQNWAAPAKILIAQEQYNKLKNEVEISERHIEQNTPDIKEIKMTDLNIGPIQLPGLGEKTSRQQKILEILRERGRIQAWQLKQIFPSVSKRTLRRDFEDLVSQGAIQRVGERNDTSYVIAFSGQGVQPV